MSILEGGETVLPLLDIEAALLGISTNCQLLTSLQTKRLLFVMQSLSAIVGEIPLKSSGHYMYHPVEHSTILRSAHTVLFMYFV